MPENNPTERLHDISWVACLMTEICSARLNVGKPLAADWSIVAYVYVIGPKEALSSGSKRYKPGRHKHLGAEDMGFESK